jgi:hypothetical protein
MSPEIGGWNPALVFGVAVTAAVVVIGWMWTGRPKRPMFGNFARDFVINFVIVGIIVWGRGLLGASAGRALERQS